MDDVTPAPGLERDRAIRRCRTRAELARLLDGAARELVAADACRKAEVVLDPAGGAGLASERGALDHQGVEPFGGAVDRGRKPRWAGADHEQVDLLTPLELPADSQRPLHVTDRRVLQLGAAPQTPHGRLRA